MKWASATICRMINIFTPEARAQRGGARALSRARPRSWRATHVLADLEALGLIERIEPHRLTVPRGERSNAVLEPLLTDQWFVDIKPLAEPALKPSSKAASASFRRTGPAVYYEWMHKIKDWCISRQLWWGHRIPAWYDTEGRCYVARSEEEARAKYGIDPSVGAAPGRGRARHLVLLGALALLHPGLAGAHSRARDLLSDLGAGHRLRHHLLLGRPDDHDGPQVHGRGAVSRRLHPRPHPRSRRPEDVEVEGQRHRPARHRRRHLARGAARQAHHAD